MYDKKARRFVLVKSERGGGLCRLRFPLETDHKNLLEEVIDHFWSNQKGVVGNKKDYDTYLVDVKDDVIKDTIELNNQKVPFTVSSFLENMKQVRPRLYLMTKAKSFLERISFSDDSLDDFDITPQQKVETHTVSTPVADILSPVLDIPVSDSPLPASGISVPSVINLSDSPIENSSTLIGTSASRALLREEIDTAYVASLL